MSAEQDPLKAALDKHADIRYQGPARPDGSVMIAAARRAPGVTLQPYVEIGRYHGAAKHNNLDETVISRIRIKSEELDGLISGLHELRRVMLGTPTGENTRAEVEKLVEEGRKAAKKGGRK